jgi:undecaprenyl-diphosphatase
METEDRASPRPALAAAAVLAAGFVAIAVLVALEPSDPPLLGGIDRAWREIALDAPRWAETVSRWLKDFGAGTVMVPFRVGVGLWLLVRRRYAALGAWFLAWAVADVVTFALKPGVGRPRPGGGSASSFPSAHAKTAAQVAVGLALLVAGSRLARATAWAVSVGWIVAMGVSRTMLDEHWLSDVVAGAMLGAACALGSSWVVRHRAGRRATGT